jgi:hypothetical protein
MPRRVIRRATLARRVWLPHSVQRPHPRVPERSAAVGGVGRGVHDGLLPRSSGESGSRTVGFAQLVDGHFYEGPGLVTGVTDSPDPRVDTDLIHMVR